MFANFIVYWKNMSFVKGADFAEKVKRWSREKVIHQEPEVNGEQQPSSVPAFRQLNSSSQDTLYNKYAPFTWAFLHSLTHVLQSWIGYWYIF